MTPPPTSNEALATRAARATKNLRLFTTELPRAGLELGAAMAASPLLAAARRGDGQPVLVLPGLLQSDASTSVLRAYLRGLNYSVYGWQLRTNVGSTDAVVRGLRRQVASLKKDHGRPVTLIGWSLGGLYAHELARHSPGSVRQVVTMGTPVQLGGRRGRAASAVFDRLAQLNGAPTHTLHGGKPAGFECQRPRCTHEATELPPGRCAASGRAAGVRTSRCTGATSDWGTTRACC